MRLSFAGYAEYAPPKTWEQFEELCADLFQIAWKDPTLVRHGRSGQQQHGVDIVARHGAKYPVGLQCKRRMRWPVKKLTTAEIDAEVAKALKFDPPLESFYILTTADDDTKLQAHIRAINKRHKTKDLFNVVLLGWTEIVRRVTLHEDVAGKHFGGAGGTPRSPLLSAWFSSNGKLELDDRELNIAVTELAQDFHDWPTGHIAFRQRETDELLDQINAFVGRNLTLDEREERIRLRKEFRRMTDREARIVKGLTLMLSVEPISTYLLQVWEPDGDLPIAVRAFIEDELNPDLIIVKPTDVQMRITSPRDPEIWHTTYIPPSACSEIVALQQHRIAKYGHPLTDTVGELPMSVRAGFAIPAVMRSILCQLNERKTLEDLLAGDFLNISAWKVRIG